MKPVQTQVLVAHKCQCRWDSASNLRANARSHSKKRRSKAEDWFTVQICETSTFRRAHLAIAVTLKLELCTFTFCLGVIFKRFRDFLDGKNTFRETSYFGHLTDVVYENKIFSIRFKSKTFETLFLLTASKSLSDFLWYEATLRRRNGLYDESEKK